MNPPSLYSNSRSCKAPRIANSTFSPPRRFPSYHKPAKRNHMVPVLEIITDDESTGSEVSIGFDSSSQCDSSPPSMVASMSSSIENFQDVRSPSLDDRPAAPSDTLNGQERSPPKSGETTEDSQTQEGPHTIEVAPGLRLEMKSFEDTARAVADDNYTSVCCLGCHGDFFCVTDSDYMVCPSCNSVSPVHRRGVAMGFSVHELVLLQQDIVQSRAATMRSKSHFL